MEIQRLVSIVGVAVLLVLGGCLSGTGVGQPQSPSPTSSPTSTPPDSHTSSLTGCANWVSFYGLDSPGETAWEPDRIAIGYTVPANASVFFVAFEDGAVIGTTHITTRNHKFGVTADGDGIPLVEPLNGFHTIRLAAYTDTNANGQFDHGTDTRCPDDGDVVEAGPRRINFSRLQSGPPSAPLTSSLTSPTPTATPDGHEQAANQPDPDTVVQLKNEWNHSVAMHVRVIQAASNTTVHNETYELSPGTEGDVYNTISADPDGIEKFTVVLTARNTTEHVTIYTNKCYGNVHGNILEDGSVYLFYAIC